MFVQLISILIKIQVKEFIKNYTMNKKITSILMLLIAVLGFSQISNQKIHLPNLKTGLLSPTDSKKNKENPIIKTNLLYAKNYSILLDIEIIFNNLLQLDKKQF